MLSVALCIFFLAAVVMEMIHTSYNAKTVVMRVIMTGEVSTQLHGVTHLDPSPRRK